MQKHNEFINNCNSFPYAVPHAFLMHGDNSVRTNMITQQPAEKPGVPDQAQYFITGNHKVDPTEMVAVYQGQYQALAPRILPTATADREAHHYARPGYVITDQPVFASSTNMNQNRLFQPGHPGYTAPVLPITGLQPSQARFGTLPGGLSGAVYHPSYAQSLMPKSSNQPRDIFFQTGKQRTTHNLVQDEARNQTRVNSTSNPKKNSNARMNMEVNRVQNRSMKINEAKGDQTGNKLSSSKQERRKEWRYESDRWENVSALCHALEQMCLMNNNREKTKRPPVKTGFHAKTVPAVSLADYLKRIAWFFECSKECFVLALEYIHRLVKCKPEVEVNYHTVHHLVLTCIKVSAKFFDDNRFRSKFYAQVVGLQASTISAFEVKLVFLLSFDLYVQPEQYQNRHKAMLIDNQGPSKVTILPESTGHN